MLKLLHVTPLQGRTGREGGAATGRGGILHHARTEFRRWLAYTRGRMSGPGEVLESQGRDAGATAGAADLELARRALAGSAAAHEELARRLVCVPRILASLNARFGRPVGPHDLEDLSQDVLVALWRALPSFAGLASLESWAFRAAHRALLARLHRGPAGRAFADSERVEREFLVERQADEAVFQALERIEPEARRVIELKHFEELTFEEIGSTLGLSPNTAKSWYYRAIRELKRMLAADQRDEA